MKQSYPYYCDDQHITVIKCLEEVKHPAEVPCQHSGCNHLSVINRDIEINAEPHYEWYQPNKEEWESLEKSISLDLMELMKRHVRKGGFLLREL